MDGLIFALDERLADPGDTLPFAGHLDEGSYSLGDHDFALPQGIDYDLVLTNAGEGILATGILRARLVGTCDRCLEEAVLDLSAEVDGYYLFEEPAELGDDEDEADFELVSPDRTIDLAPALLTALVMETPFVVLCKDDCRGLCPICGENLNEVDCGHAQQVADMRRPLSPFAALADYDFGDAGAGEADGGEKDGPEAAVAADGAPDDWDDEDDPDLWDAWVDEDVWVDVDPDAGSEADGDDGPEANPADPDGAPAGDPAPLSPGEE